MRNKEQLTAILDAMLERIKFIEQVQFRQKSDTDELRDLVVGLYYEVRHGGIEGPPGPPGPMGPMGMQGSPGRPGECTCKPFWKRLFKSKGTNSTGPGSRVTSLYRAGPY